MSRQGLVAIGLIGASLMGCGGRDSTDLVTVPTAHLAISLLTPNTMAGATYTFTVTALDATNTVVPSYVGTVQIRTSDTSATLPANATLTRGTGTFAVVFNSTGSQTITASDTVGNATSGTSAAVAVSAIPTPTLSILSPDSVSSDSAAFTLTVNGSNFVSGSIIRWNGTNRATTYVSASVLTTQISVAEILSTTTASVTVFNPSPGGGLSNSLNFATVGSARLTGISPACLPAGEQDFDLLLAGSHFDSNSMVKWNGSDRPTTVLSSTRLAARISAADIATAGRATVSVLQESFPFLISRGGVWPYSMAVAPNGRTAYIVNWACPDDAADYFGDGTRWYNNYNFLSSQYLSTYAIDPATGLLNLILPRLLTPAYPSLYLDPLGRFAYMSAAGSISAYAVSTATGALTLTGDMGCPESCNSSIWSMAMHPSGMFAYAAYGVYDVANGVFTPRPLHIAEYRVNAGGALTKVGIVDAGVGIGSLVLDPAGRRIHVGIGPSASNAHPQPFSFSIDPAGTLSVAAPPPASPLTFEPTGHFAYASDDTLILSIYRVDSLSGSLTATALTVTARAKGKLYFEPTGKWAFIQHYVNPIQLNNDIEIFRLDTGTGALTPVGTTVTAPNVTLAAFEPTGRFCYAIDEVASRILTYRIDPITAALTLVGTGGT